MKILKKVGIVILVLIIIWNVLALFGPKEVHVERTMVMTADAATVFTEINTLKHWKNWSFWDHIDTVTMKDTWEGPEAGVGCKHGWDSPNDSVGKGSITITKSVPNKFVETELFFDGMGTSLGGWKINDSTGKVSVTTYMDVEVGFLMRPLMLFMNMDKMVGPDFEKSLGSLDKYTANMPKKVTYEVKEVDMPEMDILVVRDSVKTMDEIGPTLGKRYGEIGAQMAKGGAKMKGPVFAIYRQYSPGELIDMESGVQPDKMIKVTGKVKAEHISAGKALVVDYYGPYDTMKPAHDAIHEWAKANGKTLIDVAWEIYIGDPGLEKDPMKVLTQVVYYIQ